MFTWCIILFLSAFTDIKHVQQSDIVKVSMEEAVIEHGSQGSAVIRIIIKQGYHIQANVVKDKALVPVSLRISPVNEFIIGKPVFPSYKLYKLEGTRDFLNVFDSVLLVRIPVKTKRGTRPGNYKLEGQLDYQACDSRTCLFPRKVDVRLSVVVK